ncbi:MAG: 2-hydroxyglutaryl-CoA dehydratase [Bacillota bacterium]
MLKEYTILIPEMCPVHFALFENVFAEYGYNVKTLTNEGPAVVHEGLKYVHNDTCYPALLVTGQMLDALKSGKYDLDKVALLMTQTGGGCRASNYIYLIRKALKKANLGHIPVLSLDLGSIGLGGGFKLTPSMIKKLLVAITYGDALMLLYNQVRPYEAVKGLSDQLVDYWIKLLGQLFVQGKGYGLIQIQKNLQAMVKAFDKIERLNQDKIKVGIVGEIYMKYSPLGNNHLADFLVGEDCEIRLPSLMGFLMYSLNNSIEDVNLYGGSQFKKGIAATLLNYLSLFENLLIKAVKKYSNFTAPSPFSHLKSLVDGVIERGCKMGEGWVLTADMIDLIQTGYENIVCAQPFGCLPNHIAGKGMIRKIKELHPIANIVPIDYDPGATKVNQENRIKLMLSIAKENSGTRGQEFCPTSEDRNIKKLVGCYAPLK